MASLSATVQCTHSFLPPHMVMVVLFLATLLSLRSACSSASHPLQQPTLTFCSGKSPYYTSSPAAITSAQFASFLDAVCTGAYGAAHMSHNLSWCVAENQTVYGVAQCRPDVTVADCAACLRESSRHIAGTAVCATSAVWHDGCFLRYSDRDTSSGFREDEYTATVFNATTSRALPYRRGSKAAVRRLLAAAASSTMSSYKCSVGAGTGAGGRIHGLTRCAPGISCDDCRRCLRGALAVVDSEYNGSTGMQVLRLSCMVRYESYPFYSTTSLRHLQRATGGHDSRGSHADIALPPAAQSALAPPAGAPTQAPVPPAPTHDAYLVVLGVLLGGLVVTVVAFTCTIRVLIARDRKKQPPAQRAHIIDGMRENTIHDQGEEHRKTEEEEGSEMSSCQQIYSYEVLEAATCHFSSRNKLGSGGYGTVYKGTLENGKEVAVKRLRDCNRSSQELETEISIVATLRHKNLVRFFGYCFQEEGKFLVYEYVPNNSLEKFWHKACSQSQKLDWTTWFNIVKGIARGLRFLHNMGIIHRDLKPHNVLLDENFNPKIADFDLMRVYDKEKTHESTEKVAGTFGYMAPECTTGRKSLLSIKSDVYSYGVLVLEIITGHKIYTFEGQNSEGLVEYVWRHWTERRASDVIDGDRLGVEGLEHGRWQALRCVHVAFLCVQANRSRRPNMEQVITMLRSDDRAELPEPSLPGYLVRPTTALGVRLPCIGHR